MARDISHSLNNFLTPLQIKQQLLTMSIDAEELPAEALRVKEIGDNLHRLKIFSSELISGQLSEDESVHLQLNNFISQISETMGALCMSEFTTLTNSVKKNLPEININANCLEILILSFTAKAISNYGSADLVISADLDENRQHVMLLLESTQSGRMNIKNHPRLIAALTSLIPLNRLIRLAESEIGTVSINLEEDKRFEMAIQIKY
ncbi:MAG: hypothetical protein GXO91_07955 [FCB group bacterium]|nr:hypothetical protein [FCB group bacterium]